MTEKKGGALGFLRDLVVADVPDPTSPRDTPVPEAPRDYHSGTSPHAPGIADPQALAKLEQKLQASVPPGYAAFMEQYEALKEDLPDERTRFKVALKTSHTTAEQIVAALDQFLSVMERASSEFNHSYEETKAKRLGAAQDSIAATDELIKSNEDQIATIQNTIKSLRTKRDTDAQGMQNEAARLEGVRAGFEAAHAQVINRLTTQKNRIASMPRV